MSTLPQSSGTTWSTESEVASRPRRLPRQRSSAAQPEDLDVLEEAEEFDEDEEDEEDDIQVVVKACLHYQISREDS